MDSIEKIFGKKRSATLIKEVIKDVRKFQRFLAWFVMNDPLVQIFTSRGPNTIFNEGYRPRFDLHDIENDALIADLPDWFGCKIFGYLNVLKDCDKREFMQFIDYMFAKSHETLASVGELSMLYNLDFDYFVYENEIEKIPAGPERETFKKEPLATV